MLRKFLSNLLKYEENQKKEEITNPNPSPSSSGPTSLFTGAANTVGQSFGLAGAAAAAAFFLA